MLQIKKLLFGLEASLALTAEQADTLARAVEQAGVKTMVCFSYRYKAAARYADLLVITSDNPRDEEPEAIIADILTGLADSTVSYEVVVDRKDAILRSMQLAQPGDIIVLAGKGHEDYQILKGGVHIPMDEREIVRQCLPLVPKRQIGQ